LTTPSARNKDASRHFSLPRIHPSTRGGECALLRNTPSDVGNIGYRNEFPHTLMLDQLDVARHRKA
jgi:hypothetical protein